MNYEKALNRLCQLAREEFEEILSTKLFIVSPDGTEKLATKLTWEELSSLEPPSLQLKTLEWIGRYAGADNGLVYMGDGTMKHIDKLTQEDVSKLQEVMEAKQEESEALVELGYLIVDVARDIEELDIEKDQEKAVGNWLEYY